MIGGSQSRDVKQMTRRTTRIQLSRHALRKRDVTATLREKGRIEQAKVGLSAPRREARDQTCSPARGARFNAQQKAPGLQSRGFDL
jgi:hypothetical protein